MHSVYAQWSCTYLFHDVYRWVCKYMHIRTCTCFYMYIYIHVLYICTCIILLTAGHQTKALLNNSGPKAKRSKLEKDLNVEIISQLILLIVISVIGAIGKLSSKDNYVLMHNACTIVPWPLPCHILHLYSLATKINTHFILYYVCYMLCLVLPTYVRVHVYTCGLPVRPHACT